MKIEKWSFGLVVGVAVAGVRVFWWKNKRGL